MYMVTVAATQQLCRLGVVYSVGGKKKPPKWCLPITEYMYQCIMQSQINNANISLKKNNANKLFIRTYADLSLDHASAKQRERKE